MHTRQFSGSVAAAVSLLALAACRSTQAAVQGAPPPLEVSVTPATEQPVTTSSEWIATLDGYVNAQIHPQVSGPPDCRSWRSRCFHPSTRTIR